mgnify:CR=1 FL=1
MNSFENWKEEYGLQSEPNYSEHTEKDCKSSFEAGQQAQQAKIDELQARVDEALNMLCKLQYSSGERIYNDVGNILKGNKDETGLN